MRRVCVISCGFSEHASKRHDVSVAEMCKEAVDNGLSLVPDLNPKDIEAIVFGNMQAFEGANSPELVAVEHILGYRKPVLRIATGGTTGMTAFHGAFYNVASGMFNIAMCVAFEKNGTEGDTQFGLGAILFPDIFSMIHFGVDIESTRVGGGWGGSTGGAAFQAASYMHMSGCTPRHFSMAAAKNRRNAARNPYAHLRMPDVTVDDIEATPMVSYPLRYGHTCPTTDGACCMILAEESIAKKLCDKPAYILAVTSVSGDPTFAPGSCVMTDGAEQLPAKIASQKAYKIAGITDPKKEIDYAEVYDAWAHQELMWSERVGLFDEGKGPEAVEKGITDFDGDLPINVSGGVVSTNAIGATAMERSAYAALMVMEKSPGEMQVPKKVHKALAHGWGGLFQFVSIAIFSDKP